MNTMMNTISCLFLLTITVNAATYTVKAAGGGNYTTIQTCATAMAAGDTCTVYAGTYNENVTVPAGTAGGYKTINVNGTDKVNVLSFTLNSYTKIIGLNIQNPSAAGSKACINIAGGSTSVYITNNTITQCGSGNSRGGSMITTSNSIGASYVYIQGNSISWGCGTPSSPDACYGIQLAGHHYLVENNDISHVGIGINVAATYTMVRNNVIHDMYVAECISAPGCHMDFIFTEPGSTMPTRYNLWENNIGRDSVGADAKAFLTQADACAGQCYSVIIRFNEISRIGSGGLANDKGFPHVKLYNNTWVATNKTNPLYAATQYIANNAAYGSAINELFYYPQAMVDFNPYGTDSGTMSTYASRNNMAFCTTSPCNLRGKLYGSGSFTSDSGNRIADPKFVNYAGNDFRLAADSPANSAGAHLTTVASSDSGSGSTLVVSDANFFQDGYGLAGVNGDCISVGTAANKVCISSINYGTNTITLASSITRSAGNPVWLYSDSRGRRVLNGSAPNIGADVGGAYLALPPPTNSVPPLPPTSLTAVVR